MQTIVSKLRAAARLLARGQYGFSTLEFTLIVVLVAVAVLASVDSASGSLEIILARLSGGLAP
jgi:Flp pilus assembly pilin Flp